MALTYTPTELKRIQAIVGVTADGIMGPKTLAAIKSWQSSHGLTADGDWGPNTESAYQKSIAPAPAPAPTPVKEPVTPNPTFYPPTPTVATQPAGGSQPVTTNPTFYPTPTATTTTTTTSTPKPSTPTTPTTPTAPTQTLGANVVTGIAYKPEWSSYGVTEDVWKSLNATQQAQVAIGMNVNLANYAANANSLSLQDAVKQATNDPTLVAKYADAFGIDQLAFHQSLENLQTSTSLESQKNRQQFEADRKALAEAHAAAGSAYSGFRGQAQQQLSDTENSVVQSSRALAQKNVNQLTSAFEAKYGTAATTPATTNFVNPTANNVSVSGLYKPQASNVETVAGVLAGNIKGTEAAAKQADINAMAAQNVILAKPVPITQITL